MFVDFVQFGLHLDGEVHEVTEVSVLVDLGLQRVDAGGRHVRAANRFDLFNCPELFVVQYLIEID